MQRSYRPWIALFLALISAFSLYTSRQRQKEIKIEQQQWTRLFKEQAKQQEAADAVYGPWTEANEKLVYDMYYQQATGAYVDNNVRAEYAACCLAKIKAAFPNGLSNVGDIITVKEMKLDAQCAESISHNFKVWQPEYKRLLKKKFYAFPEVELLPEAAKAAFVNCMTDKVFAKFPNGTIKGREKAVKDLVSAARNECVITAMDGYKTPVVKEGRKLPEVKDTSSVN